MRMKNVVSKMVLFVVISALLVTTAFATTGNTPGNNARYITIQSATAELEIGSGGKALCDAYVRTIDSSYDIEVVMELIQMDTGSVKKTWETSGSLIVRLTDQPWYVTSGHEYVVKVTVKVYSGTTLIETATVYSSTISY